MSTRVHIKLRENQRIEHVDELMYLGSRISNDGRNKKEIIKRIYQDKIIFNSKKTLLILKNISIKIRNNALKKYA